MEEDKHENIYQVTFHIGFNSWIPEREVKDRLQRLENFLNGYTPFKWQFWNAVKLKETSKKD